MLSNEEVEEIKNKLIAHIESTFPVEQIESAKQQINSMNSEQLEEFLAKNKLIKEDGSSDSPTECVFCSIVSGKIQACKLDENKDAIAVLDINPISKGHALIIAKLHSDKNQKGVESLAKKISKKLKEKLSPKRVESSNSRLFGHEVINILPVYDEENFNSKRNHTSIDELEKLKLELEQKKEKIKKEKPKGKIEQIKEVLWLPKRIP
jgi:diadenosine tetraphosphate (Ap4A) HIT family hydrolase